LGLAYRSLEVEKHPVFHIWCIRLLSYGLSLLLFIFLLIEFLEVN
jgi:hypothetical protein